MVTQVGLALKQQMRVSPQLIMAGRLLTLSSAELEQAIAIELQQNPALERTRRDTSLRTGRASDLDPEATLRTVAVPVSVHEQLMAQARLLADRAEWPVIEWIIGSLDSHGYLRKTPAELAAELALPTGAVERGLSVVRELDPPGLGAYDLRDCLLIQCDRELNAPHSEIARRILVEAWEAFSQQRWKRVARCLGLTAAEIDEGRRFIRRHLYPYPLHLLHVPVDEAGFGPADLIIRQDNRQGAVAYTVETPGAVEFELRLSDSFELALRPAGKASLSPGEQEWIASHMQQARLFIAGLQQRWTTLRRIVEYLVSYQRAYLEGGPLHLLPLTRATVARELGLHESTVSRAIQGKTAQLPGGRVVLLKEFFDYSLSPKEAIRRLLAGRNDLSDGDIADRLRRSGQNCSRRTVAKYRAQLNIPSSHGRRDILN